MGEGVGLGCFVCVGVGFGAGLVGVGLGGAVELGAAVAGGGVAVVGDGPGAAVVGTDDVGAELGADAGSTTAVPVGRPFVDVPGAPGTAVALPVPVDDPLDVPADPHPSSVGVLPQLPPGSPGKAPEAIASSLQLGPDQ
ncbi:hypothetical protein GCM10009868_38800 [Terrabacter aerolatus]|uniref:Uncharacterized protein n=1 Tax=Terrabacter aerolatus TaxID=422442 RepID=A0A512D0J0_9MICO|nr:hypothetical protein [Terrabacter aerolatus]GEO29987.1 hypothetical protein TAE01_17970 [Terrabacter aerolatus]